MTKNETINSFATFAGKAGSGGIVDKARQIMLRENVEKRLSPTQSETRMNELIEALHQ